MNFQKLHSTKQNRCCEKRGVLIAHEVVGGCPVFSARPHLKSIHNHLFPPSILKINNTRFRYRFKYHGSLGQCFSTLFAQ